MKKYTNLFRQFDKLDFATNLIFKNVYESTLKNYPNSQSLLGFNHKMYIKTYREWGNMEIFNHGQNDINPLVY